MSFWLTGDRCVLSMAGGHGDRTLVDFLTIAVPQEELQDREIGVTQGENFSHLRMRRRKEFHG